MDIHPFRGTVYAGGLGPFHAPSQEEQTVLHIFGRFRLYHIQKQPDLLLDGVALTGHYDDACVFGSVFQVLLVKPAEVRNVECIDCSSFRRRPLQLNLVVFAT